MTWTAQPSDSLGEYEIGGKAWNLSRIPAGCATVPCWFSITASVFSSLVTRAGVLAQTLLARLSEASDEASLSAVGHELTRVLRSVDFSDEQRAEILSTFDQLFEFDQFVAVRSSAVGEDSTDKSYAGQLESYLYVTRETLLERVMDCFMSVFSTHCAQYRDLHAEGTSEIRCAVIVQRMIPSVRSGVMFTVNPIRGRQHEMVITASYGLGEGVVQDQAEADTYIVRRDSGILSKQAIAKKKVQVVANARREGTTVVAVDHDLSEKSVLSAADLMQLHALGRELENCFGAPQDIEWAFDEHGTLFTLQARPITGLCCDNCLVFDNSNISENYQGATTPLTYSYARKYYEDIFVGAARSFGMSRRQIASNRHVFANLISYLNGGLYYHLDNWYKIFYLIPGFHAFARPFEFGVGIPGVPDELKERVESYSRAAMSFRYRLTGVLQILLNFLRLPFVMRRHEKRFKAFSASFRTLQLESMPIDKLIDLYEKVQVELAVKWSGPLINDYYAFIFFRWAHKLSERWALRANGIEVSDLMRSKEELASVAPLRAILRLAAEVNRCEPLKGLVLRKGAGSISEIQADNSFRAFNEMMKDYIAEFGDRRFDELKLESETFAENPGLIIALLRNYVQPAEMPASEPPSYVRSAVRSRARKGVGAVLWRHPLRLCVFGTLIVLNQLTLAYREYGRLVRSRRCGLERSILKSICARLVSDGALERVEDMKFLTVEEILGFPMGALPSQSLKGLVQGRLDEFRSNEKLQRPTRIVTGRFPGLDVEQLESPTALVRIDERDDIRLQGLGCSPGSVRGRARIVSSPANCSLNKGDVLVARATDPAWAYLMVAAGGLIVERGNMLSHAAIIGRELGIPCVIGVEGAMDLLVDGAEVEINGSTGVISQKLPDSVVTDAALDAAA